MANTVINDSHAKKKLLGKHRFNIQWIDHKPMGSVTITEKNGLLYIKGEQKGVSGKEANDYVTIDGTITKVNKRNFIFEGKIVTKVYFVANGQPCIRQGTMTFRISGKRRYWRLKENANPCSSVTDYVNIYF